MSKKAHSGSTRGTAGKYGGMRDLHKAMRAGRQLRTNPAAAAQVMNLVRKSETRMAMKNAGWVDESTVQPGDFPLGNVPNLIPGYIKQIGLVGVGATINQRIGGKAKWKSIQVRGTVNAGSSQGNPELATILFVYDRRPTPALPGIADIIADNAVGFLNDANRNRFVILRRMDFQFAPAQQNQVNAGYHFIDEYIKLKGLPAEYAGVAAGTGALGDITVGALYLVIQGSVNSSGTLATHGATNLKWRIRFADVQG